MANLAAHVVPDVAMVVHVEPEIVVDTARNSARLDLCIRIGRDGQVQPPLTELNSTDWPASWSNFASSLPLMVESAARPARLCASSRPLMQDARTSPVTPVTSSDPFISLISSSLIVFGTVNVYSTLAGLLCDPQFQL